MQKPPDVRLCNVPLKNIALNLQVMDTSMGNRLGVTIKVDQSQLTVTIRWQDKKQSVVHHMHANNILIVDKRFKMPPPLSPIITSV